MKRFFLSSAVLALAVTAMAAVPDSPAETAFLSQNNISIPPGLTPPQETAIHALIKNGCSAGHHPKYYGFPMDCTGNNVTDTTNYVLLVNAAQLCAILGGCS